MAEVAAHLADEVIPHLPVRQWVLSVPKRLRPFLHQTPEVASAVLAIFLRALRSALRTASPGAPAALQDAQLGAISFPQRFGGSLNPHYHYHVLALDGVVSGDVERGVRFHEATALVARDAEALARTVQLRVLRWFARHGLLDPSAAADMRTWRGTGGFSVDGSVRIEALDRAGLERLVRYCARGPLALERLHAPSGVAALSSPDARLVYRLPEPDVHGRQELRLTPLELLERLARLVPPPRIHRHRYHGVLAPNARLRATVVSIGRPEPDDIRAGLESPLSPDHASHNPGAPPDRSDKTGPTGPPAATPRSRSSRMLWAQLLARIYEVLPLLCPVCGGEMRIISFITLPSTVERILLHLDLPHRPPRVSPARGPPQAELHLDQSPTFDLAAPEPIPDFEFDQSPPHEWDA
ncbi:MAG: IS91 family transposase [Gemmatimonadales bacterium]|nr:MAG: IS91 family transposase [Gemmatimonadales bacterium]